MDVAVIVPVAVAVVVPATKLQIFFFASAFTGQFTQQRFAAAVCRPVVSELFPFRGIPPGRASSSPTFQRLAERPLGRSFDGQPVRPAPAGIHVSTEWL